ncbi:MAG: hypothetical protein ACJ8MR_15890 [Povalibacter sp.]
MKSLRASVAMCMLGACANAHAQEMDMNVMMKWASADVIRYHIVGVYQDRINIASDGSSLADVTDGLIVDLTWQLSKSKLVGQPTFQNVKTVIKNLSDRESNCLPPVPKGPYEHYDVLSIKEDMAGALELQVRTSYPEVEVVQFCTGSRKSVPAKMETRPEPFGVVSPVIFGMELPDSGDVHISQDKKSIVTTQNGWTWTLTPSIAPK